MTRGRKKDHTLLPTRALALQRDYRARKARYVSDLESRCHAVEEENMRLRKELELAKAGVSSILSAEATHAASQLMQSLNAASASLIRFQQLAMPATTSRNLPLPPEASPQPLHGAPSGTTPQHAHDPLGYMHSHDTSNTEREHKQPHSRSSPSPTPSLGSSCCGGIVDCRGLVEEPEGGQEVGEHGEASKSYVGGEVGFQHMATRAMECRNEPGDGGITEL